MSSRVLNPEPVRTEHRTRSAGERSFWTSGHLRHTGVEPAAGSSEAATLTMEAAARAAKAGARLAKLGVHGRSARILDDDAARALVTHWLLQELAPKLGLDPSKIEIHVDSQAESRNDARQTTGVVQDGQVFLHPREFNPAAKSGRSLLAHELAHGAQLELTAPVLQHPTRAQ